MPAPVSIDAYLAGVSPGHRAALEVLRGQIAAAAPGAVEAISYAMPAFKLAGRGLVAFAAWKEHCGIYPMSHDVLDRFGAELDPWRTSKGTLRFAPDAPMPPDLVRRLVEARVEEVRAAVAAAKARRGTSALAKGAKAG